MNRARFQEVEHKYVVGDGFDLGEFRRAVDELLPMRTTSLSVRDVYYATAHQSGHLYRHRFDRELQQLTVKSLEEDSEVRLEVNLDLGLHRGDQQEAVEAFLATFGIVWRGVVRKEIEVYYFPDCEIVYYEASTDARSVRCVELEAVGQSSVEQAIKILDRYRKLVGFDGRQRTPKTLVEILFPAAGTAFRT